MNPTEDALLKGCMLLVGKINSSNSNDPLLKASPAWSELAVLAGQVWRIAQQLCEHEWKMFSDEEGAVWACDICAKKKPPVEVV